MKSVFFFISLFTIALTSQISAQSKAIETVKAYFSVLDNGDLAAFDKIAAPNFMFSAPITPVPVNADSWKMITKGFRQAFPDMKHEALDWVTEGKKIAVKGLFSGTNTGSMQGNPPSGKKVVLPFTSFIEFDNNWKIVTANAQFDNASMMKQLSPDMVSPEQIKQNAKAAYDALNRRDYAAFKQVVVADFVEYTAGPETITGVDACIEAYKMYFAMFPDLKFEILNQTLEGNRLIVESIATGTNTGTVMGMFPSTDKMVITNELDVLTIDMKTGKAISHASANPNEMLRQIGYGALENPNTSIIMAGYAAFGKGDIETLLSHYDDNITWDAIESPLKRSCKGKTEVHKFFMDIPKFVTFQKFVTTKYIADGDDVVVFLDCDLTLLSDKKAYKVHPIHHFKFKNGKVISFRENADTYQPISSVASNK